jgi:hypothetical protein
LDLSDLESHRLRGVLRPSQFVLRSVHERNVIDFASCALVQGAAENQPANVREDVSVVEALPAGSFTEPRKDEPHAVRDTALQVSPALINGIHVLENLRLDALAARQVYDFALIVEPLKIEGGTGSTVAPIAIQ